MTTRSLFIGWLFVSALACFVVWQGGRLIDEVRSLRATVAGYESATVPTPHVAGVRSVWYPAGTLAPLDKSRKMWIVYEEVAR